MATVPTRAAAVQQKDRSIRMHATAASAVGIVHLGWLLVGGLGTWWIAVPFLVLEGWGLAQFGLRAMLSWDTSAPQAEPESHPETVDRDVDIVVTCTFHTPEELERTLVSCRSVRHHRRTIVTMQTARPELLEITQSFDVDVVVAEGNHVDGFWAGARTSPFAFWLEAGQVPMPNCIEALAPTFSDAGVAYVQAGIGQLNTDSFAHLRGGRDEDAFQSRVVQPRLGSRGEASWRGGGSMVRTLAIASSGGFDPNDQASLQRAMIRLQGNGWKSHYCAEPVVVHAAAPDSLGAYLMVRRRSAIELLRVFRTPENPLRHAGLSRRQRLDHLALALGFASSVRQLSLTLLLIAILLTGAVPYSGTGGVWAAVWVPAQLLMVRANRLLARGTMERGDWTRQAWRTLAADLNAFATVLGLRRRVVAFYKTSGSGFGALEKMRLASVVLIVLDLAVVARGLTLIWPRILPRFSMSGRIIALGVGLMVIVAVVDVLQVAVRRKQRRASFRLSTDLVAVIDGHLVHVVDLAVKGLGSHLHGSSCPFELGQRVPITLRLPENSDAEQTLELDGVVRSLVDRGDHQRVGLQFGDLSPAVRTGLIAYCAVGHHTNAEKTEAHDVDPSRFEVRAPRGKLTKVASVAAMFVGVVVLFAGPAAPAALADVVTTTSVCLQTSTGAPLAGASAGFQYDEAWHSIGVTGEDGCVEGQMPGKKTRVELVHQDIRQVIRQDLGTEPRVQFSTIAVGISLTDPSGGPLADGAVQFRSAGTWKPVGVTDETGALFIEILASRRPFTMTLDGVRAEQTVDLRKTDAVSFATAPFQVSLHDSTGAPVEGGAVEYRGDDWISLGTTDANGMLSGEMLPGRVRFAMAAHGGRTTIRQQLSADSSVRFQTLPVTIDFADSTGAPLAGALVELDSAGWGELGTTDETGQIQTELLPQTRSFRVSHGQRRVRIRQDIAKDPVVRFQTVLASVAVASLDGSPLVGVPIEVHGSEWDALGSTDATGHLEAELLPVRTRFRVSWGGLRSQVRQDLASERNVQVSTVEAIIRVVDSTGEPIVGTQVDLNAQRWTFMGRTDSQGEVRREVLPTSIGFRVLHDGLRKFTRINAAVAPEAEFQTVPLRADEPGGIVEFKAGSWRPFSDGVEVLPVRLQIRLADGSKRTVNLAANSVNHLPSGTVEPLPEAGGDLEISGAGALADAPSDSAAAGETTTTTSVVGATLSTNAAPTTIFDAAENANGLSANGGVTTPTEPGESVETTVPDAVDDEAAALQDTADGSVSTTAAPGTVASVASTSSTVVASTSTSSEPPGTTSTTVAAANQPTSTAPTTIVEDLPETTTVPAADDAVTTTTILATADPETASTTEPADAGTSATSTTEAVGGGDLDSDELEDGETEVADSGNTEDAQEENSEQDASGGEVADQEIVQEVAGAVIFATPGELFDSAAVATTFTWTSPDAHTDRVLEVSLEDAAVYTDVGTASTVGYAFRVDNLTDIDLDHGSTVELHLPAAAELTAESQEEWECDANGTTWRCTHIGPLLADSSSTIHVAAALPKPDVLAISSGERSADFVVLAAAAAIMLGTLYGGVAISGRPRQR